MPQASFAELGRAPRENRLVEPTGTPLTVDEAFVGRRAGPIAPRPSAGARAAWNKWKGPAQREGGCLCRYRDFR